MRCITNAACPCRHLSQTAGWYVNNAVLCPQIYGRFLEFVRGEPGAAARFYDAALKQDTSQSLLALTAAEGAADGIRAAAGGIDETVDGLCVINAQVCAANRLICTCPCIH